MITISAILGAILLKTNPKGFLKHGIWLIIIGAILQLVAGYADSVSHDVFGAPNAKYKTKL